MFWNRSACMWCHYTASSFKRTPSHVLLKISPTSKSFWKLSFCPVFQCLGFTRVCCFFFLWHLPWYIILLWRIHFICMFHPVWKLLQPIKIVQCAMLFAIMLMMNTFISLSTRFPILHIPPFLSYSKLVCWHGWPWCSRKATSIPIRLSRTMHDLKHIGLQGQTPSHEASIGVF